MDKLLSALMGITETKLFILNALIGLAKKQNGIIELEDLEYMKSELIRMTKEDCTKEAKEYKKLSEEKQ